MQRQGHLDSLRDGAGDEQQSVLSRIRSYFGL
jgi:hypothetical protein